MFKRTNSFIDRRSGNDRRERHNVDYFLNGGSEKRRSVKERRLGLERRVDWIMLSKWTSVAKKSLGIESPG